MARGSIHMLGSNKELTIVTDQITGSGGANGPTLMIPIKIDLDGSFGRSKSNASRVEVLSVKGELKAIQGDIQCNESYKILTRNITRQSLYEEYLNFTLSNEVVNKVENIEMGKWLFCSTFIFKRGITKKCH